MQCLENSHIVYLVPHYAKIDEGSSLRSVAVARALEKSCKKLTVITPDLSERVMTEIKDKPEQDGKIDLLYMRGRENYRSSFLARFRHEWAMAKNCIRLIRQIQPDIVIASYPPAFTPFMAMVYTRLHRKCVFVLEVRDLMAGALEASGYARNPVIVYAARLYERVIMRSASAIAIVSPGMKFDISRDAPNARILPAYNGIEDTLLSFSDAMVKVDPAIDRFRASIGLSEQERYVIYAGALTQSYDLPTLIKGFANAKLPNTKFVIMGNGEKRKNYEDLAQKIAPGLVLFHDFVDRVTALKIIGQADVAMHAFGDSPHWAYVLGNKVFDYIAMGTPVLFAGTGTTADLVLNSGAGAVSPPGNVAECAKILAQLAQGSEAYKKNPVGKKYVLKYWRRSDHTENFVAHLQKLTTN